MVLDINSWELVALVVLAVVVLGPERLPNYASQLAQLVRRIKAMDLSTRERVRESLGPEFEEVDWSRLDPRRYDPRAIVREALSEPWNDVAQSTGTTSDHRGHRGSANSPTHDSRPTEGQSPSRDAEG